MRKIARRAALAAALTACGAPSDGADATRATAASVPPSSSEAPPARPPFVAQFPDDDAGAVDPPAPPCTTAPCDRVITLRSGGRDRSARVHVPSGLPGRASLVLAFHGLGMNAQSMESYTGLDALAASHGAILIYPDGVQSSWNAGGCCGVAAWVEHTDDVLFARDLVTWAKGGGGGGGASCVDDKRVFATGFSNGAFMVQRLACEAADVFAAVAPVSGVLDVDPASCRPSRAVPLLHIHGTADDVVPYGGGTPVVPIGPVSFPSVADSVGFWRRTDDCTPTGVPTYTNGKASCIAWTICALGASVELCTVDGLKHDWPTADLDASARIMDFFAAHPMP